MFSLLCEQTVQTMFILLSLFLPLLLQPSLTLLPPFLSLPLFFSPLPPPQLNSTPSSPPPSLLLPSYFLPLVCRLMKVSATFATTTPTLRRKKRGSYEEYRKWWSGWVRVGVGGQDHHISFVVIYVPYSHIVECIVLISIYLLLSTDLHSVNDSTMARLSSA